MPNSSQKNTSWDDFFLNVEVPIDFMDERDQPECQIRHSLGDDTFPIIYSHKDCIAINKPAN